MLTKIILKLITSCYFQTLAIAPAVFFSFAYLLGQTHYTLLASLILSRIGVQKLVRNLFKWDSISVSKYILINLGAIALDIFVCVFFIPEMEGLETGVMTSMMLSFLLLTTESLTDKLTSQQTDKSQEKVRVLFYGHQSHPLIKNFLASNLNRINPVGFIDEDSSRWGRITGDAVFLGGLDKLEHFIKSTLAQELVIAMDGLSSEKLKFALQVCLKNKVVPTVLGTEFEKETLKDIKSTNIFKLDELLNRKPVEVDMQPVEQMITGKVVMVTGGGGSIGSELCRQIANMSPSELIILDHSELNLYTIGEEFRDLRNIHLLLIDLKDSDSLSEAFAKYKPHIIYHAAAYKHVKLVEDNPYPSIVNNIEGTKNLIECSLDFNTPYFVLVSSDKAVNPSSIMGSTKRVCELMVTRAAMISGRRYCSVRFGNVLGSSGSLIPLLKNQILAGGPVTITDPKMIRYFMLISEAVKLVLKAGQISSPGDINVLRMGEPIKILDLAKKVIRLMGKTEREIPIVFIGMKPGEKLFEELYLSGNEATSEHPEIMVVPNGDSAYDASLFKGEDLEFVVHKLIYLAYAHDNAALKLLNNLVFMHRHERYMKDQTKQIMSSVI
jgi:FlaA1/EpsC-like NDP-sugar epimerase